MQHPTTLGKYTITSVLGEGAMGVVYKALDPGIGRQVAIKTIRKALASEQGIEDLLSARFQNEARAVGRMNHPGIVAIYELGEDQNSAFIAMEFVEGRDLSQILAATPALPEPIVLRVMHQLLDALEYAHQQGVWHRDIKPANLLITAGGQLKITDFGIARIESAALTQVVSTIGTPGYMAPEQYVGESFDHRVDIFASGVLLYRMLAGHAPFSGSMETVMYNIMNRDPASLAQYLPADAAAFYDPVIAGALAKDRNNRYANAAVFRQALLNRKTVDAASAAEATVIVQRVKTGFERTLVTPDSGRSASSAMPASTAGPSSASSQTQHTMLTGWDDSALEPVRTAMARYMGPMAKILVRQAAKKCQDMPTLIELLTQDLPTAEERNGFVAALQHQTRLGTGASQHGSSAASAVKSQTAVREALDPAMVEQAGLLMVKHMGPIAKIVVKKTAAKAASTDQFVSFLTQELTDTAQRNQFTNDIQAWITRQKR